MSEYINNLKHSFASHIDNASALISRQLSIIEEAKEGIREALKKLPREAFRIIDYEPEFYVRLSDGRSIQVSEISLSDNEIIVTSVDGFGYWELDNEWEHDSVNIFSCLTDCIQSKIHELSEIKVGSIVRWNNPGIDDYDEADREEILNLQWVVDKIPEDFEEDSVICISNEYSEAEVLPWELVLEKV